MDLGLWKLIWGFQNPQISWFRLKSSDLPNCHVPNSISTHSRLQMNSKSADSGVKIWGVEISWFQLISSDLDLNGPAF